MPRTPRTHAARRFAPLGLTLLASAALLGCSDNTTPSSAAPQSQVDARADDPRPDVYTAIRGQITQLPDQNIPGSELKIRHQQIRDFKTQDGNININSKGIKGMASMTMPFPPADGLSLDGLVVGDKIEFDFVVNWGSKTGPSWEVTRIAKLPDDTEIDYTNTIEEMPADHQQMIDKLQHDDHDDHTGHDHPEETGTDGP